MADAVADPLAMVVHAVDAVAAARAVEVAIGLEGAAGGTEAGSDVFVRATSFGLEVGEGLLG